MQDTLAHIWVSCHKLKRQPRSQVRSLLFFPARQVVGKREILGTTMPQRLNSYQMETVMLMLTVKLMVKMMVMLTMKLLLTLMVRLMLTLMVRLM